MPPVKLYTHDGKFVVELNNMPWKAPPEILVWGQRFFVWKEEPQQYREAGGMFWLDACNVPRTDPPPAPPPPEKPE